MNKSDKIEALLFDMNGVIVDDEGLHERAFRGSLEREGITLSSLDYQEFFIGKTDSEGIRSFLGDRADKTKILQTKERLYFELLGQDIPLYNDIAILLQTLKANSIKIAVVTSASRAEADLILSGLKDYLDAIITAQDTVRSKPDPQGYLLAANKLGVAATNCLVIEDAPSGILAAKRAGMRVLALLHTHEEGALWQADAILSSFGNGKKFLDIVLKPKDSQ